MRRQRVNKIPDGAVACGENEKYFVTRDGRVFSAMRADQLLMLRPSVNNLGYHKVALAIAGQQKKRLVSVHRLVAVAFVPNPEGKPEVNHRDLDKLNNWAENLEWVTHRENLQHARENRTWDKSSRELVGLVAFPFWPESAPQNDGKVLRFESAAKACEHFGKKLTTFAPMIHRGMRKQWIVAGHWWRRAK